MDFIRRLFVSETDFLTRQRDWFRERCDELGSLLRQKDSALSSEIRRNRKREDYLTNQIIELGGGRRLSPRIEEEKKPEPTLAGLGPAEETTLRERAREYCEQRHPDAIDENVEQAFQMMKADPDYWLAD